MQQISLAQTEDYANSGEYYTQGDDCETTEENSDLIETKLFGGGDVITKELDMKCVYNSMAQLIWLKHPMEKLIT